MNVPKDQISTTGYGVDVAVRRADDLDKKLLGEVSAWPGATVLDIGCGAGGAASRLAALGATVTAVDQHDFSAAFHHLPRTTFLQASIETYQPDQTFDFGLCQRTLHYLPYRKAQTFLAQLRPFVAQKLFLSLSGLDSELSRGYAAKYTNIEDRFGSLAEADQVTFGMNAPLCLYTKDEATQLLAAAGWHIEEVWQSAFGNIKLIARAKGL